MKFPDRLLQKYAICKDIYVIIRRYQTSIIIILLILVLILFLLNYAIQSGYSITIFSKYISNNLIEIVQVSNLVKDIFTLLAIVVAGIWSYYIFIKGRTFKPKLTMKIYIKSKVQNELVIIRIVINNTGKTRIKPLYATLQIYSSYLKQNKIGYCYFDEIENILTPYIEKNTNNISIEPDVEMNIDIPLTISRIKDSNVEKNASLVDLLLFNLTFVDNKYNKFKEITILPIK